MDFSPAGCEDPWLKTVNWKVHEKEDKENTSAYISCFIVAVCFWGFAGVSLAEIKGDWYGI